MQTFVMPIQPRIVHQPLTRVTQYCTTYNNLLQLRLTMQCQISTVRSSPQINRQSIQEPFPVTQSPSSPAVHFIKELSMFVDTIAWKTGVHMANQLIRFLYNPDFDIRTFREKLRNISDCTKVISKGSDTVFRNNGFEQL